LLRHNCGHDPAKVLKILTIFIKTFHPDKRPLKAFIDGDNLSDARRLVHSTKAAGGYLGAKKLTSLALELEQLIDSKKKAEVDKKSRDFIAELNRVLESVEKVVGELELVNN
jgi:HPt (histidine-containing phosphotransfer) domain-containing protein